MLKNIVFGVKVATNDDFCQGTVPISPNAHDINIYPEKVEMGPEPEAMSDALRVDILRVS